jgi:integrase
MISKQWWTHPVASRAGSRTAETKTTLITPGNPAPAVKAAKIQKRVGFHTFRRTCTTLLTQNNEEVKVVQELLRHANSRITLDLYAQAGMPNKGLAQSKLVPMVLNKGEALA